MRSTQSTTSSCNTDGTSYEVATCSSNYQPLEADPLPNSTTTIISNSSTISHVVQPPRRRLTQNTTYKAQATTTTQNNINSSTCQRWLSSTMITIMMLAAQLTKSMAFPVRQNLLNEVTDQLGWVTDEEVKFQHEMDALRALRHHKHKQNWMKEALVYLRDFGYLEEGVPVTSEYVSAGLSAYQKLSGITVTGTINSDTIQSMRTPRCGNADIPVRAQPRFKRFARVSKWTDKLDGDDTLRLTWFIETYTNKIPANKIKEVVREAFDLWSKQIEHPDLRSVKLSFSESPSSAAADINILWASGDHGDSYPFDGNGQTENILAHTFYPKYQETGSLNGDIHFDDDENWVLDNCGNGENKAICFPYVLVHEIGHALGLGHSNDFNAVMNPHYKSRPLREVTLAPDDKCAVNWNYVGSSQRCLFLYIMVELFPRAKPNDQNIDQLTSMMHDTTAVDSNVIESMLSSLNNSIPVCRDSNNVTKQAEVLLENHLDFPHDTAQSFGPVMCNFFDGLANMVQVRTDRNVVRKESLDTFTAHTYPHRVARNRDHYQDFDELASPDSDNSLRRRRRGVRAEPSDVYNKEYFNEQFFESLLTELLASR